MTLSSSSTKTFAFLLPILTLLVCVTKVQASSYILSTTPEQITKALNEHLDVINRCTKSTYRKSRTYYYYNQKLNQKLSSSAEIRKVNSFYAESISPPLSQYTAAKALQKNIPTPHRDSLSLLFDSLWNLQIVQNTICEQLHELTQNQPSVEDTATVNQVYQRLYELDQIGQNYRRLALGMEQLAKRVHSKHCPPPSPTNAWVVSATTMKSALDTAHQLLEMTRAGAFTAENPIDTIQLGLMLTRLQEQRTNNLGDIRDLGTSNGNSAPHRYDKVVDQLHRMMKAYHDSKPVTAYAPPAYEIIVNEYNQAVEHYNAFARISAQDDMIEVPAHLLQTVKELGLYRMVRPALTAPTPNPVVEMVGYAYNHTILLLDASGSMNHPTKMPLIKEAIQQLSTAMRENDRLTVVVYSDDAHAVLTNVSFTDQQAISTLLSLHTQGKTNAREGIQLAYQLAQSEYIPDGNNRIILATDGGFEISKETHKLIRTGNKERIVFTVFGFGSRIDNQKQLQQLAKEGKGHYIRIKKENSLSAMIDELTAVKAHID